MSRVDELFRAYVAEHRRAHRADPISYLDEVTGAERVELAALIDHFLVTAPRRPFDAAAFERFRSRADVSEMVRRIVAPEPSTLAALRQRAAMSKQAVGERLARDLGVEGCASEAKARYHDLETGAVQPARVRARVWEVLAAAFGETVATVRAAATSAIEPPRAGQVFARAELDRAPGGSPVRGGTRAARQMRVDDVFFVADDE